jgi:hypothetical protein
MDDMTAGWFREQAAVPLPLLEHLKQQFDSETKAPAPEERAVYERAIQEFLVFAAHLLRSNAPVSVSYGEHGMVLNLQDGTTVLLTPAQTVPQDRPAPAYGLSDKGRPQPRVLHSLERPGIVIPLTGKPPGA